MTVAPCLTRFCLTEVLLGLIQELLKVSIKPQDMLRQLRKDKEFKSLVLKRLLTRISGSLRLIWLKLLKDLVRIRTEIMLIKYFNNYVGS